MKSESDKEEKKKGLENEKNKVWMWKCKIWNGKNWTTNMKISIQKVKNNENLN